jgi:hypothetical protein
MAVWTGQDDVLMPSTLAGSTVVTIKTDLQSTITNAPLDDVK